MELCCIKVHLCWSTLPDRFGFCYVYSHKMEGGAELDEIEKFPGEIPIATWEFYFFLYCQQIDSRYAQWILEDHFVGICGNRRQKLNSLTV